MIAALISPAPGKTSAAAAILLLLFTSPQAMAQEHPSRQFGLQLGARLEEHVLSGRLAILPLGAMEYHGPSGPALADSLIADGIASRLATQLKASLFPVVSYTHCPAHTAVFRGSISVRPATVTRLLEDILSGIVDIGFDRVLVLNAHNGNIGPAQAAISQVTRERPQTQMLLVSWWETLPTPDVEALGLFTSGNGGHGHGGPLELSVTAVFAPGSVRAGLAPDLPALFGQAPFPYYLEKSDTSGWPGYSGKLSEIDSGKGEVLVDLAVRRIRDLAEKWLADDSKPGSW